MSHWTCPACLGPVTPLGTLGDRTHGRCRSCGLDQSRTATPLPPRFEEAQERPPGEDPDADNDWAEEHEFPENDMK